MKAFDIFNLGPEVLESFRYQTDQIADQTIDDIISSGQEEQVNTVMMRLFQNSGFHRGIFEDLGKELSGHLDTYFEKTHALPDWADPSKIRSGEKIFSLYGPEIFMLLNVSSLPLCYTCANGALVLYKTGRLVVHNQDIDPLARRLMETAQMVVNVLAEGGLSKNGAGIVTLQKVRLIHASIRYYLTKGPKASWNADEHGKPINQEDLAGTLMSFGPVILNGLRNLGIQLTDEQECDYMHCWKVVGHLMGISPELLPDTFDEGFELATKILEHQAAPSEAGGALTSSCIKFIGSLIPGNSFDQVPDYFMEFFLRDFSKSSGKDLGRCIGLDNSPSTKDKIVLRLTKWFSSELSHLDESKLVQKISVHFNHLIVSGIIHHFNDGKKVQFNIPPSLQKNWGLINEWDTTLATPGVFGARLALQRKTEKIKNRKP